MRFTDDRRALVLPPRPAFLAALAALALLAAPAADAATFRYASSSNRIYVENGGIATLSDIRAQTASLPASALVRSGATWTLNANLIVEDGSTLRLHGTAAGGDVDELRLKSDAGGHVMIHVQYGTLSIDSTTIRSWDASAGAPDSNHADGRAFIRVRSFLDSTGIARESRMDIVDSDLGYLGYNASESYGVVWKVIGSPGADFSLYDKVNVYGDITRSRLHHNYFGMYTYGHEGGRWTGNEVDHNVKYGFDPHDDSDNLLIEDNDVHDNGNHGIIASKRCNNVVIRNNRSYGNTGNGIMLHRSSNDGIVEGNQSYLNSDSGIALFANRRSIVRDNVLLDNGNAGIRLSMGEADALIENNEIGFSGKYGFYFYRGSDTPEPGDDGRPKRNTFRGNTVHDVASDAIKMTDGDGNRFLGNTFRNNGSVLRFTRSTAVRLENNELPADVVLKVAGSDSVTTVVDVLRQPQLKVEFGNSDAAVRFRDNDNAIFDPDEALFTTTSTTSSLLSLTSANTAGATTVRTRALNAVPASGKVYVQPTVWNTSGDRDKAWRMRSPSSGSVSVSYAVGDLAPGVSYGVFRNGTRVGTHTATAQGTIAFSHAPGTTSTVTYTVTPD